MKSSSPPLASLVRVGAKIEEHVHHRRVVRTADDRWCVVGKERGVDERHELRVLRQQPTHSGCVAPLHRVVHLLMRRTCRRETLLNVSLERTPIVKAVLARQHELRVGKRDARFVGKRCTHASKRGGVARGEGLQQLFGLRLLLREVDAQGQRAFER